MPTRTRFASRNSALAAALAAAVIAMHADGAMAQLPPQAAEQGTRAWIFARLATADHLLRHGRPRAAAHAFEDVLAQTQGTEWGTLAQLGLAWSAATSGDVEFGHAVALDAQASAGPAALTANVVLGLLSARRGDYGAATAQLNAASASNPSPSEANVVLLAKAYVDFWAGNFDRAVAAFEAVTVASPGGPLADDGRYGAAWARHRSGAHQRALEDLAALVADAPVGHEFQPVPQRIVELDARAILAASTRGHRRDPPQSPEAQLARMLDGDGFSRARAALRLFARAGDTEAPRDRPAVDHAAAAPSELMARDAERSSGGRPPSSPPADDGERAHAGNGMGRSMMTFIIGATLLLVAILVLARELRQRATRDGVGRSRS